MEKRPSVETPPSADEVNHGLPRLSKGGFDYLMPAKYKLSNVEEARPSISSGF
jgi:hypothetical protein